MEFLQEYENYLLFENYIIELHIHLQLLQNKYKNLHLVILYLQEDILNVLHTNLLLYQHLLENQYQHRKNQKEFLLQQVKFITILSSQDL